MIADTIKITILVDNQAGEGLLAEHGLSLLIEAGNRCILFDTGQGGALFANAEKLGIDLGKIDSLVVSHGHYDHTGGISHLQLVAPGINIYCHPAVVLPRYGARNDESKSLGMPTTALAALDRFPLNKIHWANKALFLSGGIGLTGPIPRETEYEDTGERFFLDPAGHRPDLVADDMALWINTPQGLVVCVGCSHAGLVNTLSYVRRLSGATVIRAVIGGFHLLLANDLRVGRTIDFLSSLSPELVVPCHCTGDRVVQSMQEVLGDRVSAGRSGAVFLF
jgi:7,8-dihydropterin-6-yl-methyl-4-(beta-D-ribofuranosyl)aminobenzene 5'-phosphate synthase